MLSITTAGPSAQQPLHLDETSADPDNTANPPARSTTSPAAPLLVVLGAWADRARADELLPPLRGPRTVAGECLRLAGIADRLTTTWWVGDLVQALRHAAHRVTAALGEAEATIPIGACPRLADHDRDGLAYAALVDDLGARLAHLGALDAGWLCGGQVRARSYSSDAARCTRCGHRWRGRGTLRALADVLGEAMLDLGGLARYLGDVEPATLRQWAHRDGWTRERVGRARTVYSLAEARASYDRRRGGLVDELGASA